MVTRDEALDGLVEACQRLRDAQTEVEAAMVARNTAVAAVRDAGVPVRRIDEVAVARLAEAGFTDADVSDMGLSYANVRLILR